MNTLLRSTPRGVALGAAAVGLWAATAGAQPFTPGVSYFGRSNYIEYIAGELPVILSAPHGGALKPAEIPNRTNCTTCGWDFSTATDSNTEDLARRIRTEVQNLTGFIPHVTLCRLDREKIDCNRAVVEGAQGNPHAVQAWNEFQNFIIASKTNAVARHGRGFYIDLHGHGHTIQRLELGYLLTSTQLGYSDATLNSTTYENLSSIRTLSQQSPLTFPQLLRGAASFGALMAAEGYPSVPSPDMPDPDGNPYFNGGYNTVQHGSRNGGTISGLQIEHNMTGVRDFATNRAAYAQALARTLETFFAIHYGLNLRACVPKVWTAGDGNWSSTAAWHNGALPVSSNHLVFAGAGGAVTHNLAALTTGNGVISSLNFSNAATGAYTLSGNACTLLGDVANNSALPHTISNNLTFAGAATLAANTAALTFGGNVTNGALLALAAATNLTLNGVLAGGGGLAKYGAGTAMLAVANAYHGDTTLHAGTLQLSSTATLGDGAGTLNLAGGNLALSATRDTTNGVIPNPVILSGDTVIQNTTNAGTGTRNFPFGADSIHTLGGTLTIRNLAAGNVNIMNLRFQGAGFNFTRPIVFDNSLAADPNNNSVQLDSYNPTGTQTFSGDISGNGRVRRGVLFGSAAGTTILSGNNTYTGGTTINAGTLLVNNPAGSGTGAGAVLVNASGTLGGTGTISGAVSATGTVAPGTSAGTLTLGGGLDLSGGGTYRFELASLNTTGAGTNFNQLILTGGNLVLGGSARLQIHFTNPATAPDAANPFWQGIRSWQIIALAGTAANPGATRFPTVLNGAFPAGSFTNHVNAEGVWLRFVPANAFARPVIDPTFTSSVTGHVTVVWNGVEGQTYQLQYKDDLAAAGWRGLGTVIAPGGVISFTDTQAPLTQRFYRVVIP